MLWFNRSLIAVIIGCLNILTYSIVWAVLTINLKYHQFSNYDYNEYDDVYESYKQRQETQNQREFYGSIYVAMCILMVIVSVLLIWGIVEKRSRCILPWIVASFVVLVYSVIVVMEDIFIKSSFQGVANSTVFFGILFAVFGFQIFCLALVYSLYKDIKLEIKLKQHHNQPKQGDHKTIPHSGILSREENLNADEDNRKLSNIDRSKGKENGTKKSK